MSLTNPNSLTTVAQLNTVAQDITTKADNRFMKKGEGAVYTVKKQAQAETGYAHTYQLFSVGTGTGGADEPVGEKINIPKDMVVESATVETVSTADVPYEGAVVGDKYIDLVIANAAGTHVYIPVNDLVDVYTGGDGIAIDGSNVVSLDLDTTNANGLEIDSTSKKLKMGTASSSTTGALTSTDWNTFNGKQAALTAGNGIDATNFGNDTVSVKVVAANGLSVNADGVAMAAATPSVSGVGGNPGSMSPTDKEKLDGFTFATTADITEITDSIWPSA